MKQPSIWRRASGWASIWLTACAGGGPSGPEAMSPEDVPPPPAVVAVTVTAADGTPLPDPLRLGLGVRQVICGQARNAAGEDVTSPLFETPNLRAYLSSDPLVARITFVSLVAGPGLCVNVAAGSRPGTAVLVFEHFREGETGPTARVTIDTSGT